MTEPRYNDKEKAGHLLRQIARHAKGLELAAGRLAEHLETDKSGSDSSHPPSKKTEP